MFNLKEYPPKAANELLKSDYSVAFADIRPEPQFLEAHADGAIHVPFQEETYPQTAKKLLTAEKPVVLIGDDLSTIEKAARILLESGFIVEGYLDWKKWADEGFPLAKLAEISVQHLNEQVRKNKDIVLIDVRGPEEWGKEHIPNARNIPLHELEKNITSFGPDQELVTICGIGGGRSAAAYSILKRRGFQHTQLLMGGLQAWKQEDLPVEEGESRSGIV